MSRRDDCDFVLQNKAKDLYVYTSEAVGNTKVIPKHRRYTTGQRLESMALDIFLGVAAANNKDIKRHFDERQEIQDEVIALCDTMKSLINALKASKAYPGVDTHKSEVWTRHILDVFHMTKAWRDNEWERHQEENP